MDEIKKLTETSLEDIHTAFEDAFSEYEVRMSMPKDDLAEMMATRDYDHQLSLGFFADSTLSGFILVGSRMRSARRVCYDIATGVVQSFQKMGVGDRLVTALINSLRTENVEKFVLEVLTNNIAAQKLYERHGFVRTRKLCCFEISKNLIKKVSSVEYHRADAGLEFNTITEKDFNAFSPSWQNQLKSYENMADLYSVRTISHNGLLAGYGIVHKNSGKILQIGTCPHLLNQTSVGLILCLLAESTRREKLTFLNVEAGSKMEKILLLLNCSHVVDQYEMEYHF